MSTKNHFGTGMRGDDVLTKEKVRQMPSIPFSYRKHQFDIDINELMDKAVDVHASLAVKVFAKNIEKRRHVFGKWFDSYCAITKQWNTVASIYDGEYINASSGEKKRIEQEYIGFERANIRALLDSAENSIVLNTHMGAGKSKQADLIRNRIQTMKEAWCEIESRKARPTHLKVV